MYLFEDGLVRLCTSAYAKPTAANLDDTCMHLTNYSINKDSQNYVASADDGSSTATTTQRAASVALPCDVPLAHAAARASAEEAALVGGCCNDGWAGWRGG